jgi:putative transposase
MSRTRTFEPNCFYHVFNRGNRKDRIFIDDADYRRFLKYLSEMTMKYSVFIGLFCLMPNHFHFLLLQEKKTNQISPCIQKISIKYAKYFNKKYNTVGSLFQGRFKSSQIKSLAHLDYIVQYIALNPFEAGMVKNGRQVISFPWTNLPWLVTTRSHSVSCSLVKTPKLLVFRTNNYKIVYRRNTQKWLYYLQRNLTITELLNKS